MLITETDRHMDMLRIETGRHWAGEPLKEEAFKSPNHSITRSRNSFNGSMTRWLNYSIFYHAYDNHFWQFASRRVERRLC